MLDIRSYIFHWASLDGLTNWQFGFQEPATEIIVSIIDFHNFTMSFLVGIVFFVSWMVFNLLQFRTEKHHGGPGKFTHSTALEVVWTLTPAIILVLIADKSFKLLQSMDRVPEPELTVKVVGHQWYWSYEYSDFVQNDLPDLNYDSYMLKEEANPRLLAVDHDLVLPTKTNIRLLITSSDVLHSWAVPSLGIKVDACPGRLNQNMVNIFREGTYYGQCSEICGVNHGFMPIVVRAESIEGYDQWLVENFLPNLDTTGWNQAGEGVDSES